MPTPVENYIFNELPRRFVADSSLATGSSLTASWLLVATGSGFQVNLIDPTTLGFEPKLTAGNGTQYYRGDKTWATLNAAAVGAIATSQKGQALGVATLDADGYVELSQINPAVIERVVVVADEAARYALTTAQVQNGDVVNQQLDGNNDPNSSMWFVYDDTNLDNSSGYLPFSAGVAASVQWSGVSGKPAIIGDLEAISNPNDTDILWFQDGSLVVTDIDTLKTELALGISDITDLEDDLGKKQDQAEILDRLSELPTQVNKFGILVRDTDGYFQGREVVGTNGITVTEGKGNADNISVGLTEVGTSGTYGDDDNFPVYEVNAYGQVTGTTTKSLVKDTLTLLDQVADQTLVANNTYEIGEYTNTLNLVMPDPVPGGTTITLAVPMILGTSVGDINISFPVAKPLFGFITSLPLKSTLYPLPGDRIVFIYVASESKWMAYKTVGLYHREMYVVSDSTANPNLEPSFFHSVASKATDSRVLSIPDRDVDLSSVGQTEFTSSEFRVVDTTDQSKKVAFSVGSVGAGNTSIITVPDSPVDLGDIGKVSPYLLPTASFTAIANRRYSLINATGSIDITLPTTPTDGDTVEVYLAAIPANNTVRFLKSDKDFYFSGNTSTSVQPNAGDLVSTYLWVFSGDSNCWIQNIHSLEGSFTSSKFTLRDTTSWNKIAKFNVSGLTSGSPRTITVPDADVDLGLVGQTDFLDTAFRISDNSDSTKKIAFEASGIATDQTRTITMPDREVNLGEVGLMPWIRLTPSDGETITLASGKLYHVYNANGGVGTLSFRLPSSPSVNDVVEVHDVGNSLASTTTLKFISDKTFLFPHGISSGGGVSGSAPNIEWTDTRRTTNKTWRFTYYNEYYGGFWVVEEDGAGGARSEEMSIIRKGMSAYGVKFNIDSITQDRSISVPDSNVDLGLVGRTDFADNQFRISDNTDSTKKIAFEASGIATGQTRTITMPNIDVDLGKAVYRKDIFNLPVPLSSLRAGDEIDLTVSLATVSMQHSDTFSTVKGYYFNNNTQGTVTFTLSRSLGTAPPTTLTNIDGVTGETLSSQDFTVTPTAFDYTVYIPRYGRLLISPGSSGQVRLVVYSPQSNSISTNNSLWCESTTLAGSHNTAIKCKDLKIHADQKFGRFEDLWGFPLTSQLPGATSPANGILVPIGTKMRGFKGNSFVGSTSGCRVEAVFTRTVVGTSGATVTMSDSDGITPYSHMASWSGNDPVTEHYITLRRGNAYSLTLYTVGPSLGSGAVVGSTTLHSVGTLPAVSVSISGGRLIASFTSPSQAYYSYEIRSVYGVDL